MITARFSIQKRLHVSWPSDTQSTIAPMGDEERSGLGSMFAFFMLLRVLLSCTLV